MGARGPAAGAGAITQWILDRLREGPKTVSEIEYGSSFMPQSVNSAIHRLQRQNVIEPIMDPHTGRPVTRRGKANQHARVYAIIGGSKIAPAISYPAAQNHKTHIRALNDAINSIVSSRPTPSR